MPLVSVSGNEGLGEGGRTRFASPVPPSVSFDLYHENAFLHKYI